MSNAPQDSGEAGGGAQQRPWWLAAGVLAVGAILIFDALRMPLGQTYAALGPGFFVLVIGAALVILAGVLAYQMASGVAFEPEAAEGADLDQPISWYGLALAGAGVASPIALIPWLGFPMAGGIAYAFITRAYGSRRTIIDLPIGLAVASLTWLAFTRLGVQLGSFLPFWIK